LHQTTNELGLGLNCQPKYPREEVAFCVCFWRMYSLSFWNQLFWRIYSRTIRM